MTIFLNFPFEKKAKANGSIYIEGYSNYNVPDRGFERVEPKGGRFDNYKKNPIILFDHGKDPAFGSMPVGRAIEIEARDDGLYTKAYISNSKTEKISAIRDLVEEGILKTFSIGFDPLHDEKDGDGVRVITDFELIEQSIVPIPMNQDSTFSVLQKRFQKNKNYFGQMFCEERRLLTKGAVEAAGIVMMAYKSGKHIEQILGHVAKITQTPMDVIRAAIYGDIQPMPREIKQAFIRVLKGSKMDDSKPKEKPMVKADPQEPVMVLLKVMVPKDLFDDLEMASQFVEEHGYKVGVGDENDEYFIFQQVEGEGIEVSEASTVKLGDGLMGLVAPSKGAKSSETPDPKEEMPTDEKACTEKPKEKSTKADETPTIAIPSGSAAVQPDQNPHLELMRQTNVLLGALIQEVQKLNEKIVKYEPAKVAEGESESEEGEMESEDGMDEIKSLDNISKFRDNIEQVLKRMNF